MGDMGRLLSRGRVIVSRFIAVGQPHFAAAGDESWPRRSSQVHQRPRPQERRMARITPNLWFDTESQEAAEYYISIFPNSYVKNIFYYGEAGPRPAGMVLTVDFVLDGQDFTAINGGPEFTFNESVSLLVNCADQDEVDYYWDQLGAGG